MADRLVIDTGPLIALARVEALDLLGRLPYAFVAPDEVREELALGVARGRPSIAPSWLVFVSVTGVDPVARAELGLGEAAVIRLAQVEGIPTVAIDERKGRRAASAAGLQVVGTLGLIARAKSLGLVPAARPIMERLKDERAGWFDEELVAAVLAGLDE